MGLPARRTSRHRSPEDCTRTITATIERTGIRHLIFLVEVTGDAARTIETVERMGADVLPAVGHATTTLPNVIE